MHKVYLITYTIGDSWDIYIKLTRTPFQFLMALAEGYITNSLTFLEN